MAHLPLQVTISKFVITTIVRLLINYLYYDPTRVSVSVNGRRTISNYQLICS